MKLRISPFLAVSYFLLPLSNSYALQSQPDSTVERANEPTPPTPYSLEPEDESKLSTQVSVYIKGYQFYGNTAFSDEVLAEIALPYIEREVYAEELIELKDKITSHYVTNGFINSGALLPDQDIEDGIIVFQILEGTLENVQIVKKDRLSNRYIAKRIEKGIRPPLNIVKLQKNLKLLEQDATIESIQATLEPSSQLGAGILSIEVREKDQWSGGFATSNHNAANVGQYSAELYAQASNLTGMGDTLDASVGWRFGDDARIRVNENIFYSLYGTIPVTRWDTTLTCGFSKNAANIINENFRTLDIENESYKYSLELRHPIYRQPNHEFGMAIRLVHRSTSASISGIALPLGSGRTSDRVTALSLVNDWVLRSQTSAMALYSSVDFGVDLFNATMDPTENNPDARFVTWIFQGQYLQRLQTWDSQILLKGTLRLSDTVLLPSEKFTLGGATTVRGYRENTLARDYGALATVEYRIPVFELKLPGISKQRSDGQVKLATFYDFGWAENKNGTREIRSINILHSLGLGLLWQMNRISSAELYWGYPLKSIDYNLEYDLQEAGIHFRMNIGMF